MQTVSLSFIIYGVIYICRATEVEHRLEKLESLVREHLNDAEVLVHRLDILERNIADLAAESTRARVVKETQPEHGQRYTDNGQNSLSDLFLESRHISKRTTDQDVSFHAYMRTSQSYYTHEILKFDTPSLNVRGGYTPDDGIFDVPVSGVYVFTWTVAVPPSVGKIVTELVVHGHVKGVIVSDPDVSVLSGSGVHPATAVVITHADAGDNVYIRMRQAIGSRVNVLSDDHLVRTTFSGWLLD